MHYLGVHDGVVTALPVVVHVYRVSIIPVDALTYEHKGAR